MSSVVVGVESDQVAIEDTEQDLASHREYSVSLVSLRQASWNAGRTGRPQNWEKECARRIQSELRESRLVRTSHSLRSVVGSTEELQTDRAWAKRSFAAP